MFVSYARAIVDTDFVSAARASGLRTAEQRRGRVRREADGAAVWARWPVDVPRVSGCLKIDVAAATAANFVVTTIEE
jgi:hypothetical protein